MRRLLLSERDGEGWLGMGVGRLRGLTHRCRSLASSPLVEEPGWRPLANAQHADCSKIAGELRQLRNVGGVNDVATLRRRGHDDRVDGGRAFDGSERSAAKPSRTRRGRREAVTGADQAMYENSTNGGSRQFFGQRAVACRGPFYCSRPRIGSLRSFPQRVFGVRDSVYIGWRGSERIRAPKSFLMRGHRTTLGA